MRFAPMAVMGKTEDSGSEKESKREREVSWYTKHVACKKQEGLALRARECVDTREIDRNQQRLPSERLNVETLSLLFCSVLFLQPAPTSPASPSWSFQSLCNQPRMKESVCVYFISDVLAISIKIKVNNECKFIFMKFDNQ